MKLWAFWAPLCGLALASTHGATFTVTHTDDFGFDSLRYAISTANAAPGDDTITITATGTLTLASALPTITGANKVTIAGPGTNSLTISGNNAVQVFTVNTQAIVMISGLTIANGRATNYSNGAGIENAGSLTISNCALVNNQTFGGWGGGVFNSGNLVIINSALLGNQVTGEKGSDNAGVGTAGGGGVGMGGGLFTISGTAVITGCSFISNSATGGSGGVFGPGSGTGRGGGINGGQRGGFQTDGQSGGLGGGGGGGGYSGVGGDGGLGGGGGGGGYATAGNPSGGRGGFGGGTGGSGGTICGGPGGGGAGLGGGVFVHSGTVTILNCAFAGNQVIGGLAGAGGPCAGQASNGSGIGPDFLNSAGTILPMLTATLLGGGGVVADPPGPPYLANSLATVTATPTAGWTLLQWLGDATGTNQVVELHMNRNKFVQPVFGTPLSYARSISVSPQSAFYPYGTVVRITATPANGEYFVAWTGDASGTNNPMTFVITNPAPNISCQLAALKLGESSLTVVANGSGHVEVIPAKTRYAINETVGLIPVSERGQEFIGWSGDASGTQNPLLVSMAQSRVITASFTKRPSLRVGTPLEGLTEDGFRLTLIGEFATRYTILGSANLADWGAAGTVTNTYGMVQLTDPAATNIPHRYYRSMSDE